MRQPELARFAAVQTQYADDVALRIDPERVRVFQEPYAPGPEEAALGVEDRHRVRGAQADVDGVAGVDGHSGDVRPGPIRHPLPVIPGPVGHPLIGEGHLRGRG